MLTFLLCFHGRILINYTWNSLLIQLPKNSSRILKLFLLEAHLFNYFGHSEEGNQNQKQNKRQVFFSIARKKLSFWVEYWKLVSQYLALLLPRLYFLKKAVSWVLIQQKKNLFFMILLSLSCGHFNSLLTGLSQFTNS